MRKLLLPIPVALLSLSFVAGCGQTGDLVLPDRDDETAIEEEQEKEAD